MAISLSFSIVFYKTSTHEAEVSLQRQTATLQALPQSGLSAGSIEQAGLEQLDSFRQHLISRLALVNLVMLVTGTALSYWLAKRNLEPIEEALEAQARFTSDAAHELRTPLTAMKTEIEVGLRQGNLSVKEAKTLLESNLEEVVKLETLTSALLRMAQVSQGKGQIQQENLSVQKLLKEAAQRVKSSAKAREIQIDTSGINDAVVSGDLAQLRELFVILLDNAIKYGRDGMAISLASRLVENHVKITVTDQGIGMKASDIEHIFERFYRADQSRTKNKASGFGLGLSLAKAIVDNHGGEITATSKPNEGSTFTIALPLAEA
jgi:signal transduction histidine kinase